MKKPAQFTKNLLKWFETNQRRFPWRETANPYNILIAEVLLRKTDAKKVLSIYDTFIEKYPNCTKLASSGAELQNLLRPIGLYRKKAKDFVIMASIIETKYCRQIPESKDLLLKLPGVGNYIANAVLCFAFRQPYPLVDTNVIRVVTRVFSITAKTKRARTDAALWQFMEKMLPRDKCREFNLSIIDLGALICLLRKPKCQICPIGLICCYYNEKQKKQGTI